MAIEKELLDQLLAGRDPSEVFAKDGLLDDLKKALSERILSAELDEHLARRYDHGNRIWLLLSAEVWYRRYISRRSEADLEIELSDRLAEPGVAALSRRAS